MALTAGPGPGPGGNVRPLPADTDPEGKRSLGVLVMLASSGVMFAALMIAYALLRTNAKVWPPPGVPPIPLVLPSMATAILAASSATLQHGLGTIRRARPHEFRTWLFATLALGAAFLVCQCVVWLQLHGEGLRTNGVYGGFFYIITIFHAAHVVAALGLLAWLVPGARAGAFTARDHLRPKLTTMFWHFLGIAWIAIFVGVYLL